VIPPYRQLLRDLPIGHHKASYTFWGGALTIHESRNPQSFALRFRALLTEDGARRIELARACKEE
jgi:hypothetical protein